MHVFAETEGDMKNVLEMTYTDGAKGMPRAIWFVPINAQPSIDVSHGLHLTCALPLCVDLGCCFQFSIQCLSSNHDSNCD
eukprot:SAG31_NODE_21994_length_536_cov_0.881007_1_plen_79_part_10